MDVLEIVFTDMRHFTLRGGAAATATAAGLTPRYRGHVSITRDGELGRTRYQVTTDRAPAKAAKAAKQPAPTADVDPAVAAVHRQLTEELARMEPDAKGRAAQGVKDYIDLLGKKRFGELTLEQAHGALDIARQHGPDELPF
jgi:hypothetical protein